MKTKRTVMLSLWIIYFVIFVASAVIDLAMSPGLDWALWVWIGLGIGFVITTANLIINYTTCPHCGRIVKAGGYCEKCGSKIEEK